MPRGKEPRYIEFTPDNLRAMKISNNKSRYIYRDKNAHHFAVARFGEDEWRYYAAFTRSDLNGAKAAGIDVPAAFHFVGSDLERGRAEANRLHTIYKPLRVRKKKGFRNLVFHKVGNSDQVVTGLVEQSSKLDNPNPDYEPLMSVLMDAYVQAAAGKGSDRHGRGRDFLQQDLVSITDAVGIGGPMFQAIKKLLEGRHLSHDKARAEYLGAIVYIAGLVAWMDRKKD